MMILAAVLLVIGLIALAGMVARVNQLGSQTTVESNKAILGEVSPLAAALDVAVADLAASPFALTTATTPTLEQAIVSYVEHLQRLEAARGFILDYELTCTGVTNKSTGAGGNAAQGIVVAHLSDGTVWVEVRSTVYFVRGATSASCASVYG